MEGSVVIEEPASRPFQRSATDLFRAGVGAAIVSSGVLIDRVGGFDDSLTDGFAEPFAALPDWLERVLVDGGAVVAVLAVMAVLAGVLARRSPRFLFVAAGGAIIGAALTVLLTPAAGGLAAVTAVVSLSSVWVGRTWSRWLWTLVILLAVVWTVGESGSAGIVLIQIGAGVLGASIFGFALGRPDLRPRGADIVEAFGRAGLPLSALRAAAVDARGSTPYFGTTVDGREVFIKVLAEDERSSDLLFRAYRAALMRDAGDFRPFSSLRRAVEHEALVSLWVSAQGLRTPAVAAMATVGTDGIGLAYERVDGRSLDAVEAEAITDEVLREVWTAVDELRAHGVAHRDLRLANVFLVADGSTMLIDFGFSEMAATPTQLRGDVAELLLSTAARVGAERAVAACVGVLGVEALADAAPRVQPSAVSSATRRAVAAQPGLADEVEAAVRAATGQERIRFERLERIRASTMLLVGTAVLASYLLVPQLVGFRALWSQVDDVHWGWMVGAVVVAFLMVPGAALSLSGVAPVHLRPRPTLLAQLAGSFLNHFVPWRLGGPAVNIRFLQKQGVESTGAVAAVGAQQVGGILVHLGMTVAFGAIAGVGGGRLVLAVDVVGLGVLLVAVAVVLGLLSLFPSFRRRLASGFRPVTRAGVGALANVMRRPRGMLRLLGGVALLNLASITALAICVRAFGASMPFAEVAVAFLAGSAIASCVPTPGNIGAMEAALTAALVTLGLDEDIALGAVLMFRIATFWIPMVPGWLAMVRLTRQGDL